MQAPASADGSYPQRFTSTYSISSDVACTFLLQVLLVCRWPKACDIVCEGLDVIVQFPYTAGRSRSFSMTDAALHSQIAVFMEMHVFSC